MQLIPITNYNYPNPGIYNVDKSLATSYKYKE